MKKLCSIVIFAVVYILAPATEFSQSSTLLSRRCAGASPVVDRSKIEAEKDGDIAITPCAGRSINFGAGATVSGLSFSSYTKAALPSGVSTGTHARVTDSTRGIWRYEATLAQWVPADNGRHLNMLDFCNPVTDADCGPEMQTAINVISALGGGTINFPTGHTFRFSTPLDLSMTQGIIFQGHGGTNQNAGGINLQYTGTGTTPAFDVRSAFGFRLINLHIQYTSASFTGWLIQGGHDPAADTQMLDIDNCLIEGTATAFNAAGLVNMPLSIITSIRNSHFYYAEKGVGGQDATGFSYVMELVNNTFNFINIPIWNPDNSWTIKGNTFEPDRFGRTIAVDSDTIHSIRGFEFSQNWVGDSTNPITQPVVRLRNCIGCSITNNFVEVNGGTIVELNGADAVSITGNRFETTAGTTTSYALNGTTTSNRAVTLSNNSMGTTNGVVKTGTNVCITQWANTMSGVPQTPEYGCGLSVDVPLIVTRTITAAGTTGNRTINQPGGTVNVAAGASALTVTNSTVTVNSIIGVTARTNDATCSVKNYVPAAGSFVINMDAACTAETSVGFIVTN